MVLDNVSWRTYESLLADYRDRSVPHFSYDRGLLEIMSPSTPHERDNRTIALLAEIVAEELGINVIDVGSMTFKRRDLEQGFEPDSSFYIQHEAVVRERTQIDLAVDPPPDLVIEIEVSHPAIAKLPMFAAMGIPEVWRFDGERIVILRLEGGTYHETAKSLAFPFLTGEVVTRFLVESRTLKRTAWTGALREWVRGERAAGNRPA
jgi:Uma2 family endonuclease